jgi:hypothetical protein
LVRETKYEITSDMTEAYENACQMNVIKTNRGEEEKDADRSMSTLTQANRRGPE